MRRDKPPLTGCRALAGMFVAFAFGLPGSALPAAETAAAPASTPGAAATRKPAKAPLVDINSASRAQLKTLPGVGDVEADRIVAGRPYLSKADLASRNVVPTGVYLSLKNRIIAIQKQERKPKQ